MAANLTSQLLILLTYLVSIQCQFEFNDLQVVHDLVLDAVQAGKTSCIVILRPIDENWQEKSAIDWLTYHLARDYISNYSNKIPTVMSYTTEMYEKDYLDPQRRKRDTCFFGLTVVMVSESTNLQLSHLSADIHKFENQFWLLFANRSELTGLFQNVHIRPSTIIWVAEQMGRGAFVNLSEIGRFGEDVESVGYILWSKDNGMFSRSKTLHANIKGLTLNVGTLDDIPYVGVHRNASGDIISVTGFYGELWNLLQEILQFKSVFIEPDDGALGICDENRTCTGLFGMLANKQVDVILSTLTMSQERSEIVRFLHAVIKTKYKIFYKKDAEIFDMFKIFRPLDNSVWIVLIIWIILGGIAAKVITTVEKSFQNPHRHFSFISCMYFVLRTLCNQGYEQTPKLWALRIFFITAYLTATLIITSYSASLISVLTVKTPVEPFTHLNDILETDYQIIIHSESMDFDFFAKTTDKIHRRIYEKSVIKTESFYEYTDAVNAVCKTPKKVFFGTTGDVAATYQVDVVACVVLPLTSEISPAYQTIAIAKHSQYRRHLNIRLFRLIEVGLVDRYRKLYLSDAYDTSVEKEIGISLADVGAMFVYLFALQVLSVGIFILEIFWWQHHLQKHYRIKTSRDPLTGYMGRFNTKLAN